MGITPRTEVNVETQGEERRKCIMSFGGIILLAVVVAVIVIFSKVRRNSQKIQELDDILGKPGK
jgi:CHASE3 domain sensor protein